MRLLLASALVLSFLAGCSGNPAKPSAHDYPPYEQSPEAAQQKMCVEENIGMLRFSRKVLEEFCPKLKTGFELTCMRFAHSTKDWYKACPGIDTPEKLECFSTVANGQGYATVEILQKCSTARNRKQIYCLSERVARSSIPLLPEDVQLCLDKNAGSEAKSGEHCGWGVADPVACQSTKR
jgi:hypothetical protein